jgi:arabinofuranosyltransferase
MVSVFWDLADSAQGNRDLPGPARPGQCVKSKPDETARAALRCPAAADILDSVRAPLTFGRFWANLTGAQTSGSPGIPLPRSAAGDS